MEDTWDPDWDPVVQPVLLNTRPKESRRLRSRTQSEPNFAKFLQSNKVHVMSLQNSFSSGDMLSRALGNYFLHFFIFVSGFLHSVCEGIDRSLNLSYNKVKI